MRKTSPLSCPPVFKDSSFTPRLKLSTTPSFHTRFSHLRAILRASWEKNAAGLVLVCFPSLSCLVSSSSMVIRTLPCFPNPAASSWAWVWVEAAPLWSSSSLLHNPYFFSLRDSCFFFSDAVAFSLAGSVTAEAWKKRGSVERGGVSLYGRKERERDREK